MSADLKLNYAVYLYSGLVNLREKVKYTQNIRPAQGQLMLKERKANRILLYFTSPVGDFTDTGSMGVGSWSRNVCKDGAILPAE